MKALFRKPLIVLFVMGLFGALAIPALASAPRTVTVTQDQINNNYRVTNPWRRSVSDVSVDLQAGQIVIYSTHTYRGGTAYAVATTAIPGVENGRIFWDVRSASVDGGEIPADLLAQINDWMDASWRNYVRHQHSGRVTAIEITDDALNVTYMAAS